MWSIRFDRFDRFDRFEPVFFGMGLGRGGGVEIGAESRYKRARDVEGEGCFCYDDERYDERSFERV